MTYTGPWKSSQRPASSTPRISLPPLSTGSLFPLDGAKHDQNREETLAALHSTPLHSTNSHGGTVT